MDDKGTKVVAGLAEGQLWKTDNTYLQIVELGRKLTLYKLMKDPRQPVVMTRMIRTDALAVYLMATEATLVNCPTAEAEARARQSATAPRLPCLKSDFLGNHEGLAVLA